MNEVRTIDLPIISNADIAPETLARVNAFVKYICASGDVDTERRQLSEEMQLTYSTIHWYSQQLRKLFEQAFVHAFGVATRQICPSASTQN